MPPQIMEMTATPRSVVACAKARILLLILERLDRQPSLPEMLFMTESCYCSVAYGMRGQACTTPNWRGSPIPIGAEGESQLFCGRNIIWMATAAKQLNGALTIWLSVRCGPTAK